MANEWFRPALIELIDSYKENENLYNPKHALYYNKQARKQSLEAILESVKKLRKETTIQDINKKIQSLRTQFGQEVQKIERSKAHEDEKLIYLPKVWWFPRFEFIASYMKMRSDPSTPLSVKIEQTSLSGKDLEGAETTHIYEVVSERAATNADDFEEDGTGSTEDESIAVPAKRRRRVAQYPISIKEQADDDTRTIEYIINGQDEPGELTTANAEEYVEIRGHSKQSPTTPSSAATATVTINNIGKRQKRRSAAFGKYIGTLMREIIDDKVFCETQHEILKIIEKASQRKS